MCVNGFLSFTDIDPVMRRNVVYQNATEYYGEFDIFYSPKRDLYVFNYKCQYFCSCLEQKIILKVFLE